jgi:thiol-disulfide isomerase/thioredoxin
LALKEPDLPPGMQNLVNSKDSAAVNYYNKIHFWDGVNFWDGRLLYTPFLSAKMDKYYTEIVERKADSAIKQIDWMMSTAVASEEMTHFILEKIFYGAMYHQFKWEDPVFIHLFEKYIAEKSYPWLLPEERKTLTEYAHTLIANNKGTKAYEISLAGLNGQKQSLLSDNYKYTLLVFWDVTCSHCQETLPLLDSLYQSTWKKAGFRIFAVSVESDGTRENWEGFIKAHHLEEWTHVYYSINDEREVAEKTGKTALQPYNIWYYPSFYLLDQDKRFMAKKLSYQPMVELINSIIKKK